MSFPSSPSNGQQTIVNGITYTYSSTTQSWTRVLYGNLTSLNVSNLYVSNTTPSTSNTTGALVVTGGMGISGNVNITGKVVTSRANLIDVHYPSTGTWTYDDGTDIGIRFHYYDTSYKTAGLVFAQDTNELEFYSNGIVTNGLFSGTYGQFKSGGIQLLNTVASNNTTSGSLVVAGGVGVSGNVYSNAIYTNGLFYAANNNPISTGGGGITTGQVTAIAMGFALP